MSEDDFYFNDYNSFYFYIVYESMEDNVHDNKFLRSTNCSPSFTPENIWNLKPIFSRYEVR